jgi:hypothetical protein
MTTSPVANRIKNWINRRALTAWTCWICGADVPGDVKTCCI